MSQENLRTPRLELAPLANDHLKFEIELDSDPEVLRYLDPRGRTREEVIRDHTVRMARGHQIDGLGVWAGFTRGHVPGQFVGLWMLQPPHGPSQPFVPGEADLGFRLLRRWWRRGLASEGARELLRHGFVDLGLSRIFAQTMAVNRPSRATLESLGLTFVRSFHEEYDEPIPGHEHGEVEYEMRRAEWTTNGTSRRSGSRGGSAHVDGRAGIDATLVRRLIADQFPRWAHLPVTPVEVDGWDNRTYRLGDEMTVRLPTHKSYVPAVDKEDRWLPVLAPHLPVRIPVPLAKGRPGQGYPYHWSIRRWIDGETARPDRIGSLSEFAGAVAEFILALQAIDATDGPAAGAHSFYRGAPPAYYDDETRRAIAALGDRIDGRRASAVWDAALAAAWRGRPRWFHGDVSRGNLLVRDGVLAGVIDFGTSGVGDPACDLVIAWTLFHGESRDVFHRTVDQDAGSWARARGWALWKSLITLARDVDSPTAAAHRRVIDEVLAYAATS